MTIADLERRLQIEQEALERAVQADNPIAKALYRQGVNIAQRALDEALRRESILTQPAVTGCQSGGRRGCTCPRCFG